MSTGAIIGIVVAVVVVLAVVGVALWARRRSGARLRPLEPKAREHFARRWAQAQEHFVERPDAALAEADSIVADVMTERGYPADADHRRREADLGRDDREKYHAAHAVLERVHDGGASTEDMREAMIRYRALFQALVGESRARASH
ncbi:hypothetical protein ACFQV2_18895 [Actinokineospora soli]|uniref:Secreted protein n=1 Tax=Actinokineospora soli TaxID=1048753 RepID=A0ABW2TPD9_9PSEU